MLGSEESEVWACQGCGATRCELTQRLCKECHRFFYPEAHTTTKPPEGLVEQRERMRLCPLPSNYYNDPLEDMKKINPFADPEYGKKYLEHLDKFHDELQVLFEQLDTLLKAVQRYEQHYKEVRSQDEPRQS